MKFGLALTGNGLEDSRQLAAKARTCGLRTHIPNGEGFPPARLIGICDTEREARIVRAHLSPSSGKVELFYQPASRHTRKGERMGWGVYRLDVSKAVRF